MKIAILGAGAFGTALGGILADNHYDIDYYDPKFGKENLSDVLNGADYVVLCAPSNAVSNILPLLPKDISLIIATKGLFGDKLFHDFKDFMVLSGPGFANDIKAKKETKFTVTDDRLVKLFKAKYIVFDQTDDKNGVLMCGALKNVYAIWAGVLGLKRDTAKWKKYINDVVKEMRDVWAANGAKGDTAGLVCGISDLKLTCDYPSRNYEFGDNLRLDPNFVSQKTVEGLSALRRLESGEIKIPSKANILKKIIKESYKWN